MNTYGINVNIISLEKAAEATANWENSRGWHSAVYYDRTDGEVWTRDESEDSEMCYDSGSILCVLRTVRHTSPQRIMDCIKEVLEIEEKCGK